MKATLILACLAVWQLTAQTEPRRITPSRTPSAIFFIGGGTDAKTIDPTD